ncbi:MAG TPA: PD-(D/E)XK nuclease family protein [Dehalococcoidia bacterium]|nr:PD-(D/E)XK nuclease family protein [Dehalococcoidia bacterium]
MTQRDEWRLSASWLKCFKACPMRCKYAYVMGLRPIEETDALRMGSNWHSVLEIGNTPEGAMCPNCAGGGGHGKCPICDGTGAMPDPVEAVTRYLNAAYETCPINKSTDEWEVERNILYYSFLAYQKYWEDDEIEVIDTEIPFRLKLCNPLTGATLPDVIVLGKIDKIVRLSNGVIRLMEHKSTSKSIESDSLYWQHLRLDPQFNLYPYAGRVYQTQGKLDCLSATDPLITGVYHDVWHKPQIRPKKLTQADSKKFVTDGLYCGMPFKVDDNLIRINGVAAEIEPGAKEGTFAIRETPDMFGARLYSDIASRPEYYFARREVSTIDDKLDKFEQEMYNIYQVARAMEKRGLWWQNDTQCEATFRCPYVPICYYDVAVDPNNPPDGFEIIFRQEHSIQE